MHLGSPRSLLDRLLGLAFGVLLVALMLYWAACLLQAVWETLAIAGAVVLLTLALAAGLRVFLARRRYW